MEYNKIWIQNHSVTKTKTISSGNPKSVEVTLFPSCANPSTSNITNTSITYKVTIAPKKQHCVNTNKFLARQVFGTYAIRLISQMVSSTR